MMPSWVNTEVATSQAAVKRAQEEAAQQQQQQNVASGLNPDGSPIRQKFDSMIDPATGLLKKEYLLSADKLSARLAGPAQQLQAGQLDPSKMEGYNLLKKEATRTGPSQWAQLQQQKLDLNRMSDMEKAARQSNSSTAMARSGLAMRGGLSSGARERLASQGARGLMEARQGIGRQNSQNQLALLSDDEKNRLAQLSQFQGQEMGLNQFNVNQNTDASKFNIGNNLAQERFNIGQETGNDRFNLEAQARIQQGNIGNALGEVGQGRSYNTDTYKEELKKWAAERQAQATANSGGGGGK